MNTGRMHWFQLRKFLNYWFRTEIIEVSPNYLPDFTVECVLAVLVIAVYCYLIWVVDRSRREHARFLRPNSIQCSKELKKTGGPMNIAINDSEINMKSWRNRDFINDIPLGMHIRASEENIKRTRSFMERLIKLTPSEFVHQDRENQMRKTDYVKSLTSLYLNITSNLFTEEELRKQIDATREHCLLSQATHELMNYIDSTCVSDSLIDLLSDIIEEENDTIVPTHLLGDLTAFLYDIGNMQEQVLFEKAREASLSPSVSSSTTDHFNSPD